MPEALPAMAVDRSGVGRWQPARGPLPPFALSLGVPTSERAKACPHTPLPALPVAFCSKAKSGGSAAGGARPA